MTTEYREVSARFKKYYDCSSGQSTICRDQLKTAYLVAIDMAMHFVGRNHLGIPQSEMETCQRGASGEEETPFAPEKCGQEILLKAPQPASHAEALLSASDAEEIPKRPAGERAGWKSRATATELLPEK